MEGVEARLGRSFTRYGPATVFTGPVRKWKKRWIPYAPTMSNNGTNNNHHHHSSATSNSAVSNGNNGSRLLLNKWAPITPSQNGNNNGMATERATSTTTIAIMTNLKTAWRPQHRQKWRYISLLDLEDV